MQGRASTKSLDHRVACLATQRHGLFTRAEALHLGATKGIIDWRVASKRWDSLGEGVYRLAGVPETWRQRLLTACLVGGIDSVASHRSAGALKNLPGTSEGIVEISVPNGRRMRRSAVIVHRVRDLAPVDVTVVDAIPVTTPTRTLIDLASVVSVDVLEEALDDALRRRLTSVPRLLWRLDELGKAGRVGVTAVRELLALRGGPGSTPQSVMETRFLQVLRRSRLPMPVCQYEIRDNGRVVAVPDFAYPDARLAIEVDGYRWHSGRARWQRDLERRNMLSTVGWQVIHVTSSDLEHRPLYVIDTIVGVLKTRRA